MPSKPDQDCRQKHCKPNEEDNGFEGLQAIEGTSLLGAHDGVMDDDLFELMSTSEPHLTDE